MLQLFVLYACVHLRAHLPIPQAGLTRCVQSEVFFDVKQCKSELLKFRKADQVANHNNNYSRSWAECEETNAKSWIPTTATWSSREYRAQADVSDADALADLLAPLSPQARLTLKSENFRHQFRGNFQGPGNLSFFLIGTGSRVIAYAITNLDDSQFAQIATAVSLYRGSGKNLCFDCMAEDAGVKTHYPVQRSRQPLPPPGGVETVR